MREQGRRLDFIDQLRGLAIIGVFLVHTLGAAFQIDDFPWKGWHRVLTADKAFWLFAPLSAGRFGVAVFFVVSGFCIHLSFSRRSDWGTFFSRRFFRIYPPYLVALLVFGFLFPLTRLGFHVPHDLVQLGTHLLLIHNLGNSTFGGINGAFWSIAVEAQLYALYPVLYALADRFGWGRTLAITATIEIMLRGCAFLYIQGDPTPTHPLFFPSLLGGNPLFFWFSWALGAYAAEGYIQGIDLPLGKIPLPLPAAGFVAAELFKPLSVFLFTFAALFTAALLCKVLAGKLEFTGQWPRPLQQYLSGAGERSYSIYLLHYPLLCWMAVELRQDLPASLNDAIVIFFLLNASWLLIVPLASIWYQQCELPGVALGRAVEERGVRLCDGLAAVLFAARERLFGLAPAVLENEP